MRTWEIKPWSKGLSKTRMSSLTLQAPEKKSNTEPILSLSTLKSQKESPKLVPRREFTDWFTSQLLVPTRTQSPWISKLKPSDNSLSKKPSQMQPFSDHAQFLVRMTTSHQTFKDKLTISSIISFWFMTIVLLLSNQSRTEMSENVFWMHWRWKNQRYKFLKLKGKTYELGGPHVLSMKEIHEIIFNTLKFKPHLAYVNKEWALKATGPLYNW